MHVVDISLPASWKTTEVGFYEYLYVMIFDNSDVFVKNFRIYLGNKIYFAEQLTFDIHQNLNTNTDDLNSGGIFNYACSSATRTVEFSIKDGLNYKVKIHVELSNYVNNQWDTNTANYDSKSILSINYLLSNYVPSNPLTVWNSSYLNLVPFRYLFISSPELLDYRYSAPNTYSSGIIKKVLITKQLGGKINDAGATLNEDYIDVGNRNIKRLSFKKTDETGKVMNLYDLNIQFALLLSHPSY